MSEGRRRRRKLVAVMGHWPDGREILYAEVEVYAYIFWILLLNEDGLIL